MCKADAWGDWSQALSRAWRRAKPATAFALAAARKATTVSAVTSVPSQMATANLRAAACSSELNRMSSVAAVSRPASPRARLPITIERPRWPYFANQAP